MSHLLEQDDESTMELGEGVWIKKTKWSPEDCQLKLHSKFISEPAFIETKKQKQNNA